MGLACLRGLWIGGVREAFSLAAIAAACLSVRFGTLPLATWLLRESPLELAPLAARLFAGVVLALATVLAVGSLGRWLRRGLRAAGLGLADRLVGGLLGAAEGALLVALAVLAVGGLLGLEHPLLRESRVVAALDTARQGLRSATPDVAAPSPSARR